MKQQKTPLTKPAGNIFDTKRQTPLDPRIHPLFQPSNFPPELDYTGAFARAALLATRLLRIKQSTHWFFTLWFGKNRKSRVPSSYRDSEAPDVPEEYATNRRIGELTAEEVKAVERELLVLARRVRFQVSELPFESIGWTFPMPAEEGQQGCASLITFGRELYHAVRRERRPVQRDLLDYMLALTMVHELGHAAHSHLFGERCEDFCGGALIAEAGFDYMHALFGAMPVVRLLGEEREPVAWWATWEAVGVLKEDCYPLEEVCRVMRGLREEAVWVGMEGSYVRDLHDDAWWAREGERCQDVVYWRVACEPFEATLPSSFRHWICGEPGDKDDPEVKYAWADNPSLELRSLAPADAAPLEVDLPLDDEMLPAASEMPVARGKCADGLQVEEEYCCYLLLQSD